MKAARPAKLLLTALPLAAFAIAASPASALEGPWCAHRNLGRGFVENRCHMTSYEMCRADIFASPGAWCTQNPRYQPRASAPKRKAKRRPR